MPLSNEMRRLQARWTANTGWPKRLDWIEIDGLRGWSGQRFDFSFPIMAIVGENGSGKSTILQCAASVYRPPGPPSVLGNFASDFFPDTPWEIVHDAEIRWAVREGTNPWVGSVRKPGDRWRGNPERRERIVKYIDLSRIQPVPERVGYSRLAKSQHTEISATAFDKERLTRLSQIMGRHYDLAKMALTDADARRAVPVLSREGVAFSGFHQGAGETTVAELLDADLPRYSLILIDEAETSLHPSSQRRLIRDLAERCRERELQILLTTHSPYILEELPLEARAYILESLGAKEIVYGVSPDFAMTKMDDQPHYECDLYVEDDRANVLLAEILAAKAPHLVQRCQIISYGAGSVGKALGQMVAEHRFPRPSCVFLDADIGPAFGCVSLPGDSDPPERVIFSGLRQKNWGKAAQRCGRPFSDFADACNRSMTLDDPHDWVRDAATKLILSGDSLWRVLCAEWVEACLSSEDEKRIIQAVEDTLQGTAHYVLPVAAVQPIRATTPMASPQPSPTARQRRASRSSSAPPASDDLFSLPLPVNHQHDRE
jgi:predicted ATPase